MTIGFPPPKKGEKDARKCKKDCAWFDEDQEECAVVLIKETLEKVEVYTADILDTYMEATFEEET